MAKKIKVLPEHLANMIAAGEVVERPASVVKELVENSIDASADHIEIACQKSGKKMIRVLDNGDGMEYEDALLCLERHATSKISSEEDLHSIKTLGFRGEALPSIASVSEMTLITRAASAHAATKIVIQTGKLVQVNQAGSPIGTIIEIKNLFRNLPARAKFLRSEHTEMSHIVQTVTRQSIPKPEISFILVNDGYTHLHLTKALNLKERLAQILGNDQIENMQEIEEERGGVRITGYVSRLESTRSNLLGQYLYVNSRFIRSPVIQKAIHTAYHPQLARDRYPIFCIMIDLDPGRVDFNVHPTKIEIRFDEPSPIVDIISTALKKTLSQPGIFLRDSQKFDEGTSSNAVPFIIEKSISCQPARPTDTTLSQRTRKIPLLRERGKTYYGTLFPMEKDKDIIQGGSTLHKDNGTYKKELPDTREGGIQEENQPPEGAYQEFLPCGASIQIDNTYILYEATGGGVIIIDQHAAHERINYEKTLSAILSESTPSQTLITPPLITVSPEEDVLMEQAIPLLRDFGFHLDPFGIRTYILRAVPLFLTIEPTPVVQAIIHDLFEYHQSNGREQGIHPLAATIACHLSIKAHQPLKKEEREQLIMDLFSAENPYFCPHGRPTLFRISIKELEKNFGR